MVLCYVVTTSMAGFAFGMIGMVFGWSTRNQRPLLNLITIPVLLVTSYVCFRFLAKELAGKAVDLALDEKLNAEAKKRASDALVADHARESAPNLTGGSDKA